MSLAKQIGSVAKTALTNAGHMSMNNEIYARISDATAAALHLEAFAPGYKECIDREAECVNRVTKSASTAQLEANVKAVETTLSADLVKRLDEISAPIASMCGANCDLWQWNSRVW